MSDAETKRWPLFGLDSSLYPLILVIILMMFGDIMSRLSGGVQPDGKAEEDTVKDQAVSGSRRLQRGEWLATAEYLKTFAGERDTSSSESGDAITLTADEVRLAAAAARLAIEAREDQLFGEGGFVLLAVFMGDAEFAVLNVLDKETRDRQMVEVRVGESVNGYTIEVVHKLGLEAVNQEGKRIALTLFERQPKSE